ncbi:MAG: CoA-transferase [Sporomusaceae bacterium]|nr:CoA-transferase [Sporomusaceae bacterium]
MRKIPVLTAEQAAALVQDGQTITTGGFVGSSLPEALSEALEKRFLTTGKPENLTLFYSGGQGNKDGSGADHFAHEKMTGKVIAGHWNLAPKLSKLAVENKIAGYNLPQGILSCLYRDIAAKREGMISHVGLHTFVDPRNSGGKINEKAQEDLVEVIQINGKERLFFKTFPIDVAFIRGTYADETGNISFEKELGPFDATSMAQAVKNCGGKVIVQVEKIVKAGTLDPKLVKIPGIYVYAVVIGPEETQQQSLGCCFDPSLCGEARLAEECTLEPLPLSAKKIIGRRAAMELAENVVVNLGIGAPEYVAAIAGEEGISDYMTLTVEGGAVGGNPQGGVRFGGSRNADCLLEQGIQFDFYDGGGLDLACIGMAQADQQGNINVSRFGSRLAGCGGSIDITQNSKKVIFCGTFTANGLKTKVEQGSLLIEQEGKEHKFITAVDQVTFSGAYAAQNNQKVLYVTERAVFELRSDGLYLTEIAPGVDLKTHILDQMDFQPKISQELSLMNPAIFQPDTMGLQAMLKGR